MLTWPGSSIPAVLSYWLEAAQDKHGLDVNIVLDPETMAAGVCQPTTLTGDSLLRRGLSSALIWLPHISEGMYCTICFSTVRLAKVRVVIA